ncbi:uncharacterized protein V1513DRAFT_446226 [Lipomyces chichibuensis]|uniref:uncharacterized protein n=1 Tax=Lipomyces chichibuensis TaxID=1546026 RepID=UPI003342EDEC
MSSSNAPTGLSQADLLIFDDLLSQPSNAASGSGGAAKHTAPGTDWFSILANGNSLSSTAQPSLNHTDTNGFGILPNPISSPPAATARSSNYDIPRNLFTVPSPEPIQTAQLSASITPAMNSEILDDDDFGEFTGTEPDTVMKLVDETPAGQRQPVSISPVPVLSQYVVNTSVPSEPPSRLSNFTTSPISPSGLSSMRPARSSPERSIRVQSPPRGSPSQHQQQAISPHAAGYGGVYAQPLRFGQHLTQGPNGVAHLSSSIFDGQPSIGGHPHQQRRHPPTGHSHPRPPPSPQKPTTMIAKDLLDTSDDFESWQDVEDTQHQATRPPQPTTVVLPKPEFLLSLFESNLFPLPLPLFQELAPLPFPLKRRVLSHPKTKKFFASLLSGAQVAVRICAGRKRRGGRFEADREAREVARLWKVLRERIAGVGMRELPYIDASFVFREYTGDKSDLCLVCGVARHENVRGCTSMDPWDLENGGHRACIKWWAHEKARLDS